MDELKVLVDMLAHLPNAALWVLTGFLIYKLALVGSLYGVIRYGIGRLFDWLQTSKAREVEYKEIRPMLDGMCIRDVHTGCDGQAYRPVAPSSRQRGEHQQFLHPCR